MARTRIKVGDRVQVLRGDSKGERGKVLKVFPAKGRAIVEGIRTVFKHMRPNPSKGQRGGRVEQNAPLDLSNLALVDPKKDELARIAMRTLDGKRVRINKKTQEPV